VPELTLKYRELLALLNDANDPEIQAALARVMGWLLTQNKENLLRWVDQFEEDVNRDEKRLKPGHPQVPLPKNLAV
jgi:hypothetical protein